MTERSPPGAHCPEGCRIADPASNRIPGSRHKELGRSNPGYVTVRAQESGMSFARFRRSGYLHPGWGFGMTDRRFYLLLALLLLALAAGEVVYAMVGPLSETTGQLGELSSINRVR